MIPADSNRPAEGNPSASAASATDAPASRGGDTASPQQSMVIRTVGDREQVAPDPAPIESPPSAVAASPPVVAQPRTGVWYVRPQAGGQFGPATDEVLKSWITEGRVAKDALVWREGWTEWKLAHEAADALPIPLVAAPIAAAPVAPDSAASSPPPAPPAPTVEPSDPPPAAVIDAPDELEVAKPLDRRRRRDRVRMTLALALLLAVVVLAIVLVWVLFRGPRQAAVERRVDGIQVVQSLDGRYVANFRLPT